MPYLIDHLVIVVRDLARASADFESAGFTVTPGGEHVGGATQNALVVFQDGTYLELIAFKEPERSPNHKWWSRLALGEGLVDYALGTTDLATLAATLRRRGLTIEGPVAGGRQRPDGIHLAWRTIMLGRGTAGGDRLAALPFIIEDVTSRELRVPGGPASSHRLLASRVAGLTILTADLARVASTMATVLGPSAALVDPSPSGGQHTVRFALRSQTNTQWLEFCQPEPGSEADRYWRQFGDGPFEVVLARAKTMEPGAGELLDPTLLHGTRMRIEG